MSTYIPYNSLYIMDGPREKSIGTGTVIRSDNGIAGIKKSLAYSTEVGHSLGIVAEPCTAINMHNHRIGSLDFLRHVNIHLMEHLSVSDIVNVRIFLGILHLDFWKLEASETAFLRPSRLSLKTQCACKGKQ